MDYLKIGSVKLEKTAALAPMAGVADRAFREVAKSFGACYCVGEMASAKGLCYGDTKTPELLFVGESERPMAVQLFGSEPDFMARAAEIALKFSPDIIDINMGCPAPKIVNNLSGSALMKNPTLAGEIIKAVTQAVDIPVTVKFRKGWDDDSVNAIEFAEICEKNGASAICIHGRTKKQMYAPPVDIDIMREVKKAVSIPVIANGDVVDIDSAKEMYDKTGCDLIMIGRGALGHPWIFDDIKRSLYGESAKVLSVEEKMAVMREHIIKLCEYKGEVVGMKEARKHTAWYLKGFPNAAALRRETSSLNRLEDLDRLIDMVLNV